MKNGRFKGYVVRELANQSQGISACAREIIRLGKKTKKLEKGLILLSAGVILLLADTRRKYKELLERVDDIEKSDLLVVKGTLEEMDEEQKDNSENGEGEKEEGNEGKAEKESGSSFPEW